MKEIGGYFELELASNDSFMHSDGICLNSGRHALEFILLAESHRPRAIWVPSYTCDVVFQPLNRLGIEIKTYEVGENLEFIFFPIPKNEMIIVNNYFGLKDKFIASSLEYYKDNLIVDNSQSWYSPHLDGCKEFYSPRKFFGLPDGGIAYTKSSAEIRLDQDSSFDRCLHLLKRLDGFTGEGYADFKENSRKLSSDQLKRMSALTRRLLSSINFEKAKLIRKTNYSFLREALEDSNLFKTPVADSLFCPMVYPYRTIDPFLRKKLIENKVFVATYWPNVISQEDNKSTAALLSNQIIPIPVDQRYSVTDMERIINLIIK